MIPGEEVHTPKGRSWYTPEFKAEAVALAKCGDRSVTQPERVTTTVEEVTGARSHPFRSWAIDHADDFS
jgi:hypothetical protein